MNVNEFINNLDRKKRLGIGVGLAVLLFLFGFLAPMADRADQLEARHKRVSADLKEVKQLAARYRQLKAQYPGAAGISGVTLSNRVDKAVTSANVRGYVKNVSARADGTPDAEVTLRLADIPLAALTPLLEKLEGPTASATVSKAHLQADRENRNQLNVELTINGM